MISGHTASEDFSTRQKAFIAFYSITHYLSEKETSIMKYVCQVCGYVHEGDSAPAECPVCHEIGRAHV